MKHWYYHNVVCIGFNNFSGFFMLMLCILVYVFCAWPDFFYLLDYFTHLEEFQSAAIGKKLKQRPSSANICNNFVRIISVKGMLISLG